MKAATGKTVMIYGQTEVTLDLMDARKAAGSPRSTRPRTCSRTISTASQPRVTYVKDGVTHTIDCDFIAGCDGFHGVSRASVPATAIEDVRADLSVRLARHPLGDAAGQPRTDLFQPRARLCALHHALDQAQPLLRAVRARRPCRAMAGRPLLGRIEAPARPGGGRQPGHRPLDREEHRAAAQLRRRADAVRPAVPGRRRRPHRAADRRQGAQPRRQRRALSVERAARILRREIQRRHRRLFRARRWRGSGRRCASPGG